MDAAVMLIGIGCMAAGLVGGGIKLHRDAGALKSIRPQIALIGCGGILAVIGAGIAASPAADDGAMGNRQPPPGSRPRRNPAPAKNDSAAARLDAPAKVLTRETILEVDGRWRGDVIPGTLYLILTRKASFIPSRALFPRK
jgi:hypothetical protein